MRFKKRRSISTQFQYQGFSIPVELVELTGGGTDTWDVISTGHMREYERYCPIDPGHHVLEIGCGVGRDAIQLTKLITSGSYTGIDIIRPSIEWCAANITRRHPNFRFHFLDIESQIHNPTGTLDVQDVSLPVADKTIDRIILQSVFTHMFEADIVHYLHEFDRVLRPSGKVFASFFILDDESLGLARSPERSGSDALRFEVPYADGCYVNDANYPEGAVGYVPETFTRILRDGGFELDRPVHPGFWCGRQGVEDGQDIAVMIPVSATP